MSFGLNKQLVAFHSLPIRTCIVSSRHLSVRWQSSAVSIGLPSAKLAQDVHQAVVQTVSPMSRCSTWALLRNIAISFFLTQPVLLKPGLSIMKGIANSKSKILNPDSNPILRAAIKPIVYQQFCAGTNKPEIQDTIRTIQNFGFAGVVLCYGKEIQLNKDNNVLGVQGRRESDVQKWLDGNLETLDMIQGGNWLGMKYTGAGQDVTQALLKGEDPPPEFLAALRVICERARSQNCRIWIDAEQQVVQPTIDKWTYALSREFNKGNDVLVYTTVQAYLKESRKKLKYQLELAQREGWTLAVKLVRGAYIGNDIRKLIHDTKADTDASYNGIVRDLMSGTYDGYNPKTFPKMRLLLAGHNTESVRGALQLGRDLSAKGELKVYPEFGQLQGMADDIGCEIVQFGENAQAEHDAKLSKGQNPPEPFVPRAFKCLTWGSVQECMQYLVRRAIENSAAVGRMKENAAAARKEIYRRWSSPFSRRATNS